MKKKIIAYANRLKRDARAIRRRIPVGRLESLANRMEARSDQMMDIAEELLDIAKGGGK